MAILIDERTKVIVQGMTGRAGTFYTDLAMRYGTDIVGGVRPGKGGRKHLGLPMFDNVADAVGETEADASLILVPPHRTADAILDAIDAGIATIVCVTERVPIMDMVRVREALAGSNSELIGPNSQGILVPGACKIGVMSTTDAKPGPVAIVSRSASLTSEIVAQTTAAGLGQSVTIGIGGDPVHGIGFRRCLELLKDDGATEAVVLIGEIGGVEEEEAAAFLNAGDFGKPVVALIVGRHAPEQRRMGHAGTLSILGASSAAEKARRLTAAGAVVVENAEAVADALMAAMKN